MDKCTKGHSHGVNKAERLKLDRNEQVHIRAQPLCKWIRKTERQKLDRNGHVHRRAQSRCKWIRNWTEMDMSTLGSSYGVAAALMVLSAWSAVHKISGAVTFVSIGGGRLVCVCVHACVGVHACTCALLCVCVFEVVTVKNEVNFDWCWYRSFVMHLESFWLFYIWTRVNIVTFLLQGGYAPWIWQQAETLSWRAGHRILWGLADRGLCLGKLCDSPW